MINKEELEKELKKAKLGALIFFIATMCCYGLSIAMVIVAIIVGGDKWYPYGYAAGLFVSLGFAFLVMRSVFFASKVRFIMNMVYQQEHPEPLKQPQIQVENIEPFKQENTREQKLYEQYENLYKQGYISKEDLDKKKEELLGK